MTYNELFANDSLFTELNKSGILNFVNDDNIHSLDLIFVTSYGGRQLCKNIEGLSLSDISDILITQFSEKWNRTFTLLYNSIIIGEESKKIIEDVGENTDTKNITTNNDDKTTAYNEDTMVDENSEINTINENKNNKNNNTQTTSIKSFNAIKEQLEIFDTNFISNVCKDIANTITLKIY